jgi:hypothetical protein
MSTVLYYFFHILQKGTVYVLNFATGFKLEPYIVLGIAKRLEI